MLAACCLSRLGCSRGVTRRYAPRRVPFQPYRLTARRRHDLPPVVLFVLRPLFRYCDWREAWVLRLIGERYGPVLRVATAKRVVKPSSARAATRPRKRQLRWPIGISPHLAILAVCGIAIAAVLGFTISRAAVGAGSVPALQNHASAGLLEVSFPAGWRRQPPPDTPQLGLTDELAVAAGGDARRLVVVGRATTPDPSLLPQSVLATLPDAPTPQVVELGGATFYRYLNLSPRGEGLSESVYAVPTTAGTVLALCLTPEPDASFTSTCERLVRSLKLSSRTAWPGLLPRYAAALAAAIGRLNAIRSSAGSQLSSAPDARVQASAAAELAAAHIQAASALLAVNAGPANDANSAVAAALRMTGDAYEALARAAARTDIRGYISAGASLARATDALNSAFAQLRQLGYRVG